MVLATPKELLTGAVEVEQVLEARETLKACERKAGMLAEDELTSVVGEPVAEADTIAD